VVQFEELSCHLLGGTEKNYDKSQDWYVWFPLSGRIACVHVDIRSFLLPYIGQKLETICSAPKKQNTVARSSSDVGKGLPWVEACQHTHRVTVGICDIHSIAYTQYSVTWWLKAGTLEQEKAPIVT
jgi:hypothetical protein